MAKMARPTSQRYRGEFMTNRLLAGLMAPAFCFIIARPSIEGPAGLLQISDRAKIHRDPPTNQREDVT
jgi:hypothetical protein